MDRNKFYVSVSRAKSDVTILTDDIDKLHKNAQDWCHKVTSDDFIHDLEDEIAENQAKTVGSDYKDKFQRAIDLQNLAVLSPVAIAERNKIRERYGEVTWDKLPSFSPTFDFLRFATPNQSTQKEANIKPTPLPQNEPKKWSLLFLINLILKHLFSLCQSHKSRKKSNLNVILGFPVNGGILCLLLILLLRINLQIAVVKIVYTLFGIVPTLNIII